MINLLDENGHPIDRNWETGHDVASDSFTRLTIRGSSVTLSVEPSTCSLEASSFFPQDLQEACLRTPWTNLQCGQRTTL